MKNSNIEIQHFDVFYRIERNVHHNLIEYIKLVSRETVPVVDDLYLLEIYEIMKMPVIDLSCFALRKQPIIRLKIFCCSCVNGSLFISVLTETYNKIYIVKF